jgi:hypothetical protein
MSISDSASKSSLPHDWIILTTSGYSAAIICDRRLCKRRLAMSMGSRVLTLQANNGCASMIQCDGFIEKLQGWKLRV